MARLLGIAAKPQRKGEMVVVEEAMLSHLHGLVGDCRGQPGPRQLTLLSLADWQRACGELGVELPWQTRRANLLVDELPLQQSAGSQLLLGEALLEITGETDPCERMEQAHPGLYRALLPAWRGGVTCRVVRGGVIRLGMAITLAPPEQDLTR